MPTRSAEATWKGNLKEGRGELSMESGAYAGQYTFASRFEEGKGTNPEELIGAAHAGCFAMALSNGLAKAGFTPDRVKAQARVHLDAGKGEITRIDLDVEADVPGIDDETFQKHAEQTKTTCPVSKLLNTDIRLEARLTNS